MQTVSIQHSVLVAIGISAKGEFGELRCLGPRRLVHAVIPKDTEGELF